MRLIQRLTQRERETTDSHLSNESDLSFKRRSLSEVTVKGLQPVILLLLGLSHDGGSTETQGGSGGQKTVLAQVKRRGGSGAPGGSPVRCMKCGL